MTLAISLDIITAYRDICRPLRWFPALLTGSMHSLVASPYKSAYNAAKHGIAGFTKTVALETAQARSATVLNPACRPRLQPMTHPSSMHYTYASPVRVEREPKTSDLIFAKPDAA